MGSLRLTLCVIAVIAAVLGRNALTADAQDVSVTPASPVPGSDIRLAVRGCPGTTGTAVSDAFAADASLAGKGGALTGETRVRSSLTPGRYDVTVGCDGRDVKGVLTVGVPLSAPSTPAHQVGSAAPTTPARPAVPPAPSAPAARPHLSLPTAPSSPVAPVHAGGGGTAYRVSEEARSSGPGTWQAVIGLVLAGVAAAVVIVRSVRRGRGKE